MIQEAILFHRNNVAKIAEQLIDYRYVEDLLQEYHYMLEAHGTVVLARDVLDDGKGVLSYVVTQSMFQANNPGIQINDQTFTVVRRF